MPRIGPVAIVNAPLPVWFRYMYDAEYREYVSPEKKMVQRTPSRLTIAPPSTPKTIKVQYSPVLALFDASRSICPPPPMALRALNMPGHRKQTMLMMTTWVSGLLYRIRCIVLFRVVFWRLSYVS
ncbi:hypothetical protein GGF44_000885 [Coemansia sp. RSA 1694]|nr:hypothetical protein GGF44_000885 [Coemansia sp. RSA 1694]